MTQNIPAINMIATGQKITDLRVQQACLSGTCSSNGRAPDSDSGCRRFEACYRSQCTGSFIINQIVRL